RLRALERRAVADRDERVLQSHSSRIVGVDVARDDCLDVQRLGEVAKPGVPPLVSPFERPLGSDEEALRAKGPGKARRGVGVPDGKPLARATREADETLVQLLEKGLVESRLQRRLALLRAGVCVRRSEEPAEVGVATLAFERQRAVGTRGESDLGAGDRPDAERLRRMCELERAVD